MSKQMNTKASASRVASTNTHKGGLQMNKAGVASLSNVVLYDGSIMMRQMAIAVAGICLLLGLGGCAVGMAMSGNPDPNLGAVHVGAHRMDVELHLGYPTEVIPRKDGTRQATYKFEIGNAPDAQRAGLHAGLDIATLGVWELFGTIIEASRGSTENINIVYGPDNRVLEITRVTETSPTGKEEVDIGDPTPEVREEVVEFLAGEKPPEQIQAEQLEKSAPKIEELATPNHGLATSGSEVASEIPQTHYYEEQARFTQGGDKLPEQTEAGLEEKHPSGAPFSAPGWGQQKWLKPE